MKQVLHLILALLMSFPATANNCCDWVSSGGIPEIGGRTCHETPDKGPNGGFAKICTIACVAACGPLIADVPGAQEFGPAIAAPIKAGASPRFPGTVFAPDPPVPKFG